MNVQILAMMMLSGLAAGSLTFLTTRAVEKCKELTWMDGIRKMNWAFWKAMSCLGLLIISLIASLALMSQTEEIILAWGGGMMAVIVWKSLARIVQVINEEMKKKQSAATAS